jgi:hypothetical protein
MHEDSQILKEKRKLKESKESKGKGKSKDIPASKSSPCGVGQLAGGFPLCSCSACILGITAFEAPVADHG